jgi:hypothetical protein
MVEFLGFGGGEQHSYNSDSVLQLVDGGPVTSAQKSALTEEERGNLEAQSE